MIAAATTSPPTHLTPQNITTQSKSNFALSFFFLPKNKRKAITNFYALSRVIDDAVDDHEKVEAEKLLQFWRDEIKFCYEGKPTHPITIAMQESILEFKIPRKYLDLLVEGCEWDLTKHRYSNYEELQDYCYRVAGCIGLVCMKIFEVESSETEQAAVELGLALQLTNILRDISVDAKIGRIYIPQEDIQRYRLDESEVTTGPVTPKLRILLKLMADRAETNFERAFTKLRHLPRKPLLAAWIMGRVYYGLLKKIRQEDYNVYQGKISLGKLKKLTIAMREFCRLG